MHFHRYNNLRDYLWSFFSVRVRVGVRVNVMVSDTDRVSDMNLHSYDMIPLGSIFRARFGASFLLGIGLN
jgi:hypothetical protein